MSVVDDKLIGDVWPQAHPGSDPVLYGQVSLSPEGAFEARSLQTFALTYSAGRFGLDDTGLEETALDGGGLDRKIRIFRLPEKNDCRLQRSLELDLKPTGDNPIWVRVTTEDGFNAWSSPLFVYRNAPTGE
jgi:hypothetical protein